MVFKDMTTREELLTLLPMKEHTRGKDIFRSFKDFVDKTQLPMSKLVSITTDGAPAMVGRSNGFIAKCKEEDAFPDFLNYHCIIHQQALCAKMLNMKEIMDVSTKIVCSIRTLTSETAVPCIFGGSRLQPHGSPAAYRCQMVKQGQILGKISRAAA
ncbi:hypothetical protein QQF64_010612 [Cirrhinus molitorella]|uniref:Uncharacterized protein n=1 Tax=Cirrhinus molitorella TaxID=172907 RepID=A0ABR3LWW1_9TELE